MGRKRSGATFVEVLVVIGIIGLLAATVVPSLIKAKRTAKRMVCLRNTKMIVMGLVTYAEDHEGKLPPSVQRFDGKKRSDLAANTLFHRDLGFDMTSLLRPYVPSGAFNCPEPPTSEVRPPWGSASVVYSNYLFIWGAVNSTPEPGYDRIEHAPPWATAVVDLTWNMYRNGRMVYAGNHVASGSGCAISSSFATDGEDEDEEEFRGIQYTLPSLRPINSMNASFFDGSAQEVKRRRGAWRDSGSIDQAAFHDSRVYLPARDRRR